MKRIELYLSILSISAFILKLFLVPWASFFLVFSILSLNLLYLTSSYLYQDINNIKELFHKIRTTQKKIKYFGTGFFTILIGCLLKLSFMPNANNFLAIGILLVVGSLIANYSKKPHLKMKMITHRAIIIGGIGLIVYSTPKNALIDIQYRNYPEYAKLLKKNFEDPNDTEIQKKLYKLQEEINK